mmetsp:Transcript_49464/g.138512  ORF Transcript_49464/g.138512 Transcript_49464/m.138512 type:complete len:230 (-) Transcript_49464:95-784(-)
MVCHRSPPCGQNNRRKGPPSTVHAVVYAVDEVRGGRREAHEVLLVLFHDGLDLVLQPGDVEDLGHVLVGPVRGDLPRGRWVHARELAVRLHVRVVDVHLVAATEVLDRVIVDHRRRGHRAERHGRRRGRGRRLLPSRTEPAEEGADTKAGAQRADEAHALDCGRLLHAGRQRTRVRRDARALVRGPRQRCAAAFHDVGGRGRREESKSQHDNSARHGAWREVKKRCKKS